MLLWNEQVQLRPSDDADLFPFLVRTVQEWQFLTHLSDVGQLAPSNSLLKGATLVRDDAIDQWNQWMASKMGREWFRVMRRVVLTEDFAQPERNILMTAGERVLTARHFEGVMAFADAHQKSILGPDGSGHVICETEEVVLQCVAPPPENHLRILPFHDVVSVDVLNE